MDDTLSSSIKSALSHLSELERLDAIESEDIDEMDDPFSEVDDFDDFVDFPEIVPEKEKRSYEFHDRRILQAANKMNPVLFRSHFRVTKGKNYITKYLKKLNRCLSQNGNEKSATKICKMTTGHSNSCSCL